MGSLVDSLLPRRMIRVVSTFATAALVVAVLGCDVQPGDFGGDATETDYEIDASAGMPSAVVPAAPEPEE